ncbi:hypothetical protein [Paenibacillus lentus]|nr:hypothetical protein [Paenibacillus lentus]
MNVRKVDPTCVTPEGRWQESRRCNVKHENEQRQIVWGGENEENQTLAR